MAQVITLQRFAAGAAGAVLGVCFSFFNELTQGSEHSTAARVTLEPAPEKFDVDPQAHHLFANLAQFKMVSDKAKDSYADALQALDSLFRMEEYLRTNKSSFGDRSMAESIMDKYQKSLVRFQNQAKKKASVKDEVFIEDTCVRLRDLGSHHLKNLYTLTSLRAAEDL
jgi:D-hexose-6-phosphate mutarotase